MNSRERVLTTLSFKEPDRVPYDLLACDSLRRSLGGALGIADIDLCDHFGYDIRWVSMAQPLCPVGADPTEWTPAPTSEDVEDCRERIRKTHEQGKAASTGYHMGIFEQAKCWLGDDATLVIPYDNPSAFRGMLERITEWKKVVNGAYIEAGVDIILTGDDLGAQRSLVMSPEYYREWYRPHHVELISHLHSLSSEVKVAFHCCGHVVPLIRDLIEIGVDVLQSVQAETMDLAYLKREYGRDIAFWGGVGAQSVLARSNPEQVIEGVRRTLETMAPSGGYIAAPCHVLTEEVDWKSIPAFSEAMRRYGEYAPSPLRRGLG
ncbi:MAG: uroporphyrinogen decarboxylase family protein [Armatimonadota bacterium]|nr:uroporphyrinogen decarboxylase family protein [Armatimonadota bacterium]